MGRITHKFLGSRKPRGGNRWDKKYFSQYYDNILIIKVNGKTVFYAELDFHEYGVSILYSENIDTTPFVVKQILKRKRYLELLVGDKIHLYWHLDEASNDCDIDKPFYYRKRLGIYSRCFGYKRIVGRNKHLTRKRGWKII